MRIAIDLTAVPKSKSGVGRYVFNLIYWLQKEDKENTYYLFVQDDDLNGFNVFNSNFKVIPVRSIILRNIFLRLLWEQIVLPFKLRVLKVDVLHSPHYTMPYLANVKKVVTFHDMTYFIVPEMHTRVKRLVFKKYIYISSKKANQILTISYATLDDINKILKTEKSIIVTPMGVDTRFFEDSCTDRKVLESYGIRGEYFLYVGTIEPRKNILGMLKAYSGLDANIKSKYKLVICGKKGWMYDEIYDFIKDNDLNEFVHFTGFVKDEYLPCIFKGASLFLYVSFYEGFGIPLIEAMASGVPCITSNLSSMKEVAGDACIKVNPYDVSEISEAMKNMLCNSELYNNCKLKGIERAKLYSWEVCARKTLNAYNQALL